MNSKIILVALAIMLTALNSNSQVPQKPDSAIKYEKAEYLNGDLVKYLTNRTKYPQEEMINQVNGDVIFTFTITKDGKLEDLALKNYPNSELLNSSRIAMNSLYMEWKPAMLNDTAVERKYSIVFRFRVYANSRPVDCKPQVRKLFAKQKYDRALKIINSAIADNKYDHELYELSSKIKMSLGDKDGSMTDLSMADNLKDEMMGIIDVAVMYVTRIVKLEQTNTVTTIEKR
jgi:hypothetical protein